MGFSYTSFGSSRKKSSALERLLPHHPVCPIASLEELSVVHIENVSVHPEYATYGMHSIAYNTCVGVLKLRLPFLRFRSSIKIFAVKLRLEYTGNLELYIAYRNYVCMYV